MSDAHLDGIAFRGEPLMGQGVCRRLMKRRSRAIDGEMRCERCGVIVHSDDGVQAVKSLHHRRKRSQMPKWRLWEVSNCVLLCGDGTTGCHGWVENHPDAAAEEGFHVRSWQEPREVPVKLWHLGKKVLLNDEGGWEVDNNVSCEDNA